jgi:prepilin-type N-terminal cleavage/methylation domain-containing protein
MRGEMMMNKERNGFTVIELLIVLSVAAVIAVMAIPKLGAIRNRNDMRAAKEQVAIAMSTARAAAIQKGRRSQLHVSGNQVSVTVDTSSTGLRQTVLRPIDLNSRFQVAVTVRSALDSVLVFDGRGFANTSSGGTARYVLTRNTMKDSVCVSRFGVIMKVGCAL